MDKTWEVIITALGGQAMLLVVLGFLLKIFMSHLLKKDLEAFKASTKQENAIQLEQFKTELREVAKEREVRFTILHRKVAIVLGGTYERLHGLYQAVGMYTAAFRLPTTPSRDIQLDDVNRAMRRFRNYFYPRRIYFSESLSHRIEKFQINLESATQDLATALAVEANEGVSSRSAQFEAYKTFVQEFKPLLEELRTEFRGVLTGRPIS
jgi:hypothetical protein